MRRLLAPILLIALVACDGDDRGGSQPTSPVPQTGDIVEAAQTTAATGSVALDMTVEFRGGSQVPDGTEIGMTGRTTLGEPRIAELHADFVAFGVGAIDMLIDDQAVYMRGGAIDQLLGPAKGSPEWLFVDLTSSDPATAQFAELSGGQNDASLLLYFLFGATGDVEEVGAETIDGVGTAHYSLTIDLDEALADAPADVRDALAANVDLLEAQGVETRLEADVWIDEEQLIRRVAYVYQRSEAGGGGQMITTVSLSEFGEPIELDLPDPEEVVNVTDVRGGG